MSTAAGEASRAATAAVRAPGRPRRADVEDLVLEATIELLAERGLYRTTMNAVIERSGVARATVFLRWPSREALLTAAVRRAMGRAVVTTTGDVERDIRAGAEQTQAVLASQPFRAVFPALVAALTATAASERVSYGAIAPGSARLAAEYAELAGAQGFRDDLPSSLVVDALVGALIGYYLATGRPPDDAAREAIVSVALEGLRRR